MVFGRLLAVGAACALVGCASQGSRALDVGCAATSMLILGARDTPVRDTAEVQHWYYVGRLSAQGGDWIQEVRKEFIVRKKRGPEQWREDLAECRAPWTRDMLALSEPISREEFDKAQSNTTP